MVQNKRLYNCLRQLLAYSASISPSEQDFFSVIKQGTLPRKLHVCYFARAEVEEETLKSMERYLIGVEKHFKRSLSRQRLEIIADEASYISANSSELTGFAYNLRDKNAKCEFNGINFPYDAESTIYQGKPVFFHGRSKYFGFLILRRIPGIINKN